MKSRLIYFTVAATFLWGCRTSNESVALKVLPHLVDHQGRMALEPGLLERDNYQEELRAAPELVDRIRFDVKWTRGAGGNRPDRIRIEAVGAKDLDTTFMELESSFDSLKRRSGWVEIETSSEQRVAFGEILAWRALAYDEDRLVGEARSFLWPGNRSLDSLEIQDFN